MKRILGTPLSKDAAVGTEVILVNDHMQIEWTRTRSVPWALGHGAWVVSVERRTGGYDLARLFLATKPEEPKA